MKLQLAKTIFLMSLSVMKKVLDLGEFKLGKKTDDFKYFKKQIMDFFFQALKKLFKTLVDEKIIEKCGCSAKLRQGYTSCEECGGSGYKNKK